MELELTWELDRQVVLAQLQHVILALRSSTRFGSKNRFFSSTQQAAEHPLLQGAIDLHNHLFFCAAPASALSPAAYAGEPSGLNSGAGTQSASLERDGAVDLNASINSASGWTQPLSSGAEGAHERDVVWSLRSSMQRTVTEEDMLAPFCAICRSPDATQTIASVAISGLVAIFSRPCSFITAAGISIALEAVALTRERGGSSNANEVLIARIIQAYTACIRHPAAADLAEKGYVRVVSRTLVLALRPETSPLLKRTAEAAMNTIVTTLYQRAITSGKGCTYADRQNSGKPGSSLGLGEADVTNTTAASLDGTTMMRYISSLVSGEVESLDSDGNTVTSKAGDTGSGGSPDGKGSRRDGGGGGSATSLFVVHDSGPAIQLEGLWLAQAALFAMSYHLSDAKAGLLLHAVQNDLSRALLIAGVNTSHVVVLSQILRTIHIAVKCAGQHLVPQILSFLRVLHLTPLASITGELSRVESSPTAGSGGFFGGSVSPAPPGGAASPVGPGSPTNLSYLSSAQLMDMYERKEVLLESLAEFCSDAGFLSFCYAHFDLSWHYTPVLPQLCDVLVSNAYVYGENSGGRDDGSGPGSGGEGGGGGAAGRASPRASSEGGSNSGRNTRPINHLQLVALDAAANMVSEIAFRTMSSPAVSAPSSGGAAAIAAPPSPQLPQQSAAPPLNKQLAQACVDQMISQKKLLLQFARLFEESPHKKGLPFLLEHAVRANSEEDEIAAAHHNKTWLVVRNPAGGREIGHALFRLSVLLDKRVLGDHIGDLGRERTPKPTANDMAAVLPDGTTVTDPTEVATIIATINEEQAQAGVQPPATAAERDEKSGAANGGDGVGDSTSPNPTPTTSASTGARIVPALELWQQSRETDHLIVGTVRFYEEQLKGFIEMFDFRGKALLTAIREMVYRLCLPGESQKIDRIMEAFAKHWYAQNVGEKAVNPFHSDSGAFVLSFAIIMLNTALHSKRLDRALTLADFKSMNRGIDDGNNVPEEFLSVIYEDVQKHEVIMAEMMDRGFANDVTWDLEMNSVQLRAFHGVDGTLAGMAALMRAREEEPPKSHDSSDAAREGAYPVTRKDAIQLVLDPYIFDAIWKRCLLIFTGMVDSAGAHVSRLSPRGMTIKDATEHTKALMPTELSALMSGLRGIHMLARAAHALGVSTVADQCMLSLLPHVVLELSDAQDVVDGVYRSLTKLLCSREIFALLRTTASSLSDSWPLLADFVLKLYLLGFFALPTPKAADQSPVGTKPTPATTATLPQRARHHVLLPDVLAGNPGIVESEVPAQRAPASDSSGGWFSSLFGGGGGGGNGSGKKTPGEGSARAAELRLITSQPRVRECIPDMAQLLRSLTATPLTARHQFLQALLANRTVAAAKTSQSLSTQDAFVSSYEICLSTAIAFASPPPSTSPAQVKRDGAATDDGRETPDIMALYLPHLQHIVSRTLEVVARNTSRRRAAAPGASPEPAMAYWTSLGGRMVSGVLSVIQYALALQYHKVASGGAPPALLESIWRALQVFLDLPSAIYNGLAASPIAFFTADWAGVLAARVSDTGPLPYSALEVHMLVPLISHAVARLDRSVDPNVLAAMCQASHYVATSNLYDMTEQTELFVDALLTLGSLCGQQEDGRRSSTSSLPTPFSSTTSRVSHAVGDTNSNPSLPSADVGGSRTAVNVSPAEIVGICCRHVLRRAQESQTAAAEGQVSDTAMWLERWIFCLRRLVGLVLCAGSPRAGSESLLSLQRALQDTELDSLPAGAIQSIYNDVLFPLVELVCAPGSEVVAATPTPPPASLAPLPHGSNGSAADLHNNAVEYSSPKQADAGAGKARPSSGFLVSVFGTTAPATTSTAAAPSTLSQGAAAPIRQSSLMPIMAAEVKCRVVNLLPKVLLQYTASLAEYPELLQDLWQRVLGTLYAVYTAFPSAAGSGSQPASASSRRQGSTSPNRADVEEELMSDEAVMMREAVEETVKNMVYVVVAMGSDAEGSVFQRVPYFSTTTRNLIRPFSFAGPLLAFLDAAEGGNGLGSPTR